MKKSQVLIVEDEGIVAKDLQAMLRRLGYHVPVTVGTGDQAIQAALENQPDLVLMDIQLRGNIDGVQASAAITTQQDVPIVFLTANSDEATLQRAKGIGPFGFLVKPFEERAIQAGIEMALYKHQSEKRSREREQWLATTLSSIADAVITTDPAGYVTFLNAAAEELSGWSHAEALTRHYREVFRTLDETARTPPSDRIAMALQGAPIGTGSQPTLLVTRNEKEIHIEHSVAPIRQCLQDAIDGCVIVFSDVSRRRELEEQLRQVQKMDAIGKLAGGIAHDFNNAITAIIGYAELILRRVEESDPLHGDAKQIVRAAEHSARLTHQLLAFSRKQVLQPRRLDLRKELANVEGLVRRLIGANVQLVTEVPEMVWETLADAGQFEQIVLNMAINARDAMPQGGKLTIRLANVTVTPSEALLIPDGQAGEFIRLSIGDTGTGMSPETLRRAFEPFYTTKGPGKGTGLGLATCYGIVKQTSGMITVTSFLGAGTTFYVYLPRAEAGVSESAVPFGGNAQTVGTERILVVEDEDILRELAVQVLEDLGYRVVSAEDGAAAVDVLTSAESEFDLVLSDIVMPRMSGRELFSWIGEHRPDLRVLFMSGYTDDEIIRGAVQGAEVEFLPKPFTTHLLGQKVRRVLDQARPPAIAA